MDGIKMIMHEELKICMNRECIYWDISAAYSECFMRCQHQNWKIIKVAIDFPTTSLKI